MYCLFDPFSLQFNSRFAQRLPVGLLVKATAVSIGHPTRDLTTTAPLLSELPVDFVESDAAC